MALPSGECCAELTRRETTLSTDRVSRFSARYLVILVLGVPVKDTPPEQEPEGKGTSLAFTDRRRTETTYGSSLHCSNAFSLYRYCTSPVCRFCLSSSHWANLRRPSSALESRNPKSSPAASTGFFSVLEYLSLNVCGMWSWV